MKTAVALLLVASPAFAYNEAIHSLITRSALPSSDAPVLPPTQADLDAFRELFFRTARLPARDAWGFKEFLMLDPAARVHGFDLTPDEAAPLPRTELLARASRWPDDDRRNENRYSRDPRTRQIVKAPDGSPMPYDPATLDFGGLSGTTSQGHAHYGLVEGPLSDDPEVLKKDPAHFAVPPTAHAYGAEFANLYTQLALLAAHSGLPSAEWLTLTFEGAAFHHLEDLANQIHTVQVGIYEFFQSAFLQSKLRDVETMGGLFGERKSLKQIGLRLIANHHLMSEDLFAKHVGAVDWSATDPAITDARSLIAASSVEGPQVYRLAWKFSAKTLHDGVHGHEYKSGTDDPDDYVDKAADLSEFYALEKRGVVRAATALRVWQRRFPQAQADLAGLADSLSRYHAQAAARRASYRPAGPEIQQVAWFYPIAASVLLAALFAWSWSRLSKRL